MFRANATDQRRGGRLMGARRRGRGLRPSLSALEGRMMLSVFTVTSTDDSATATGTLRWAVAQADANPGVADTIEFDSGVFDTPQTITLTPADGGQLELTNPATTTIDGTGADLLTVSGGGASRVFGVNGGSAALSGLTITGGAVADHGGGVFNSGTLTLTDCTVSGNSAQYSGGGVYGGKGSTTTLSGSTVSGDTAASGGGVENYYGTLTVTDSTISGSSAANDGGGLVNAGGQVTLSGSTVSGSTANDGGGLLNLYGQLTLTGCTISGNSAGHEGGGLYTGKNSTTTLTNSTVRDNTSSGNGGGAFNAYGSTKFEETTISGNSAQYGGGGLENSSGTMTLTDSSVSGNTAGSAGALMNFQGTTTLDNTTVSVNTAHYTGGGLYNAIQANMTVTGCTVSGNSAGHNGGGGLYQEGSSMLTVTDTTISGNSANSGGGIANLSLSTAMLTDCTIYGNTSSQGGGVVGQDATTDLVACTISGNTAVMGGGIYNDLPYGVSSTVTLTDTIVAGDVTPDGQPDEIGGSEAAEVTGSDSLIGPGGSGGIVAGTGGNIVLTDLSTLGLAPLGNYGGTTETMALLPGSPALGAGAAAKGVTTDQRGEPLDATPDIGAFQSQGFTLQAVSGSTPQSAAPGAGFANPLAVTVVANNPIEPVAGGVVAFTLKPSTDGAGADISGSTATIGANGTAQVIATANATPGSYTVTASIAGAAIAFSLTNVGSASSVSFSGLSDPTATFGSPSVTFSGDISGASTGQTVAITLDNNTVPATIGSGGAFSATFDLAGLSVAGSPYTVTYAYTSDGSTTSTTSTLTLTKATPAVGASDAGGTYDGSAFAATATVAGLNGVPTPGLENVVPSLSYYSGTYSSVAQLGGQAPLPGAPSHAGAYTVLASFPGSTDYATASSLFNFTVARAVPMVAVADAGGTYGGSAFPATATVAGVVAGTDSTPSASLEGASPSLTYYSGTYTSASQLTGLSPSAGTPSHAGAYTAVATFPGSTDYATATKLANFTIAKATPQLAWAAPAAITYGTPLSLGAQLDASAGGLRGSFSYTPGPGAILDAGAGQKLSVTFTPTDTADYNTATKSTTITVDPARPMLTVSAPGGSFDGSPIGATVTIAVVGAGTDNTPSASLEDIKPTLTYYAGSGTSGTNLGTTPPSAPGTYTVVGSFVGSTDYEAVQSAPVTFAIGKGAATVALASSGGSAVYGQSITFVATVNAAGAKPDGRVTFSDGGTAIGSARWTDRAGPRSRSRAWPSDRIRSRQTTTAAMASSPRPRAQSPSRSRPTQPGWCWCLTECSRRGSSCPSN